LNDETTLARITAASLTFSDQKNAVRGEQITHRATTDSELCPCKALARICAHLRSHAAAPDTPLHNYWDSQGQRRSITPRIITNALRHSATALRARTGIDPDLLSARSLRPGGATALLCARIDSDVIKLIGRWKSDAMFRYLRIGAHANTTDFAGMMLAAGDYTFAPSAYTNPDGHPLPREAPPDVVAALLRDHQPLPHAPPP
jgi:hypothetical protein